MPKFKVTATKDVGFEAIIEADNEEQAWAIAREDEIKNEEPDWKQTDDGHDWTLEHVWEVDTRFKVTVTQTNVFFINQDDFDEWDLEPTAEQAKRIATDERIWDENQSGDDTYSVNIEAEEVH
jgi:hypothetical protein